MIITIDGPAGSGKSSTARAVADALGYVYLDTGAMYRAAALAFLRHDAEDTSEVAQSLMPGVEIGLTFEDDGMHVHLNGDDVTDSIRTKEVGDMASRISRFRIVREVLVREQRRIAQEREHLEGGVVLDGRDTGTVVFPDADLKFFMVADVEERARRRQQEYAEQGTHVDLDTVVAELKQRDQQDRTRDISPLRQADDAIEIDTTECTFQDQVDRIVKRARAQEEYKR